MKIEISVSHETDNTILKDSFIISMVEYDSLPNVASLISLKISEIRNAITNKVIAIERNPATKPNESN